MDGRIAVGVAALALTGVTLATETEHIGLSILPAPGRIAVDGAPDDWDLSGGIFVCGDVERQRDTHAVWFHAMYDAENLYILARFIDETPLGNPGSVRGDFGFAGDSLQVRTIAAPDVAGRERVAHLTCWRDRDGLDVIDIEYGKGLDQGKIRDAKVEGAKQAFRADPDSRGYVQEIAVPWRLLVREGGAPATGGDIRITVEPNFTIGASGRLSIKDIFKPAVSVDRVFTFMASGQWGVGRLERSGGGAPRPVRLSDGREFPVRMEKGIPVVDWTGLAREETPLGFKPVRIAMPEDGFASLIIRNAEGAVVRQLLSAARLAKGEHDILWDGLTTHNGKHPGEPVPPGTYTWSAIAREAIGLRLRGWAGSAGSAPWDSGPTASWGGDHGVPAACAAAGDAVFLGWSGAEAGKALIACDLRGNVRWRNIRGGIGGASLVACDGDTVYALNPVPQDKAIYRVDARTGSYTAWEGRDTTDLAVREIAGEEKPEDPAGLAAQGGSLFVSFARSGRIAVIDGRSGDPDDRSPRRAREARALDAGWDVRDRRIGDRSGWETVGHGGR